MVSAWFKPSLEPKWLQADRVLDLVLSFAEVFVFISFCLYANVERAQDVCACVGVVCGCVSVHV